MPTPNTQWRAIWLAALGAIILAAVARSASAADAPGPTSSPATAPCAADDASLQGLIRQLDSDDWHLRQAAQQQLLSIGEPARSALQRLAASGASDEQRSTAQALLGQLDERLANAPTLITLHLHQANPRDVFAQIAAQARVSIHIWPDQLWTPQLEGRHARIDVDIDAKPFWAALAQACTAANAGIVYLGPTWPLSIGQSPDVPLAGPTSTDGLFTLEALRATRMSTISYASIKSDVNQQALDFRLYADPKAKVGSVSALHLTEAIDDKGGNCLNPGAFNAYFQETSQRQMWNLQDRLILRPDGYTRLTRAKASVEVSLIQNAQTLTLPDIQAAVKSTVNVGTWSVNVESAQVADRQASISLAIHGDVPANPDMFAVARRIRMVDANGQELTNRGGGTNLGGPGQWHINWSLTAAQSLRPPVKLEWEVPTKVERRELHFSFTDLRLPQP